VEHRYYPRLQIALEVDVFKREQLIGHVLTKDISLGGMTLKSELPTLNRKDVIALRIWIDREEHILRGYVIHTSQEYTGVMLIDMNKTTTRALFEFLREMDIPLKNALNHTEKLTMP
jgi:hypothetical protein